MKLNSKILGLTAVVILFGTVLVTTYTGDWKTASTKEPARYQSGTNQNQYNPADIRGSYTFKEISNLYEVPAEDLAAAFKLDNARFDTYKCKDLESMYAVEGKEIGTDSVRIFVALYKGLPIALNDLTYLPDTAEEILLNANKMTAEQKEFVRTHTVEADPAEIVPHE